MDISETTTSQESPITSPDFDNERNLSADVNQIMIPTTPTTAKCIEPPERQHGDALDHNEDGVENETATITSNTTFITNEQEHVLSAMLADQCDLHNCNTGIEGADDNFQLDHTDTNALNRGNCQLTLADSHPLMSPLDSANSETEQYFSFPDVVPTNETVPKKNPLVALFPADDNVDNAQTVTSHTDNIVDEQHQQKQKKQQEMNNFLSFDDDSDPELSKYQASVEPSLQSVSLVTTANGTTNKSRSQDSTPKLRKIPLTNEIHASATGSDVPDDDASSIETVSDHSFGDDHLNDEFDEYFYSPRSENNLISASVSSSLMDDAVTDGSVAGGTTTAVANPAADEAKDSRGRQRITLPDGKTRDIDMKVIDPYKRVLSHGGYLKAGGHNAIILFSACYLPDRSRTDYNYVMDNLFLYVVKTLEQLVTEDYVLIYLHGGSTRSNVPPFPWLKKCYQLLDRRLRKSLKNLFMVHPTFWLKSIVWMSRPFIR